MCAAAISCCIVVVCNAHVLCKCFCGVCSCVGMLYVVYTIYGKRAKCSLSWFRARWRSAIRSMCAMGLRPALDVSLRLTCSLYSLYFLRTLHAYVYTIPKVIRF